MVDFFLSYARQDRALAQKVVELCDDAGYKFWWDSKLLVGFVFRSTINRRIEACSAVVAIWTVRSSASPWVVAEADHGHELMKLINVCGPGFPIERIPKPFGIYNSLAWEGLGDLPEILGQGYFGLHAQPDELRAATGGRHTNVPFIEILDELYFHHVSSVRPNVEGLNNYLRRFPNGNHEAIAAKRLAELLQSLRIEKTAPEKPEYSDESQRLIELLRGVRHDGLPFWAYVSILPSKYDAFKAAQREGSLNLLNLLDWGDVVSAGIADWPSHADNQLIATRFGIDLNTLFVTSVSEPNQERR
jgi:hypothetical protein